MIIPLSSDDILYISFFLWFCSTVDLTLSHFFHFFPLFLPEFM